MRIALLGSTDLTLAIADELAGSAIGIAGVATVGQKFEISYARAKVTNVRHADVANWAEERHIPMHEYQDSQRLGEFITSVRADFGLAAGWYHMVPESVRRRCAKGFAGLHASLLPELRGGAPLNWAILTGKERTGVTLFELGEGVDDGPIYGQVDFPIAERARIADVVAQAEAAAVNLVTRCLRAIGREGLEPSPQRGTPSYCLQRIPEDSRIDWRAGSVGVDRLVRASGRPYQGAFTQFRGQTVRIWEAEPAGVDVAVYGAPGQIARLPGESGPLVVTGDGLLRLQEASNDDGNDVLPLLLQRSGDRLGAD